MNISRRFFISALATLCLGREYDLLAKASSITDKRKKPLKNKPSKYQWILNENETL